MFKSIINCKGYKFASCQHPSSRVHCTESSKYDLPLLCDLWIITQEQGLPRTYIFSDSEYEFLLSPIKTCLIMGLSLKIKFPIISIGMEAHGIIRKQE